MHYEQHNTRPLRWAKRRPQLRACGVIGWARDKFGVEKKEKVVLRLDSTESDPLDRDSHVGRYVQPLSKTKLGAVVGNRGKVFGTGQGGDDRRDYRNAVNKALFGLGDRYEGRLNLLIQLEQHSGSQAVGTYIALLFILGSLSGACQPGTERREKARCRSISKT